MPKRIITDSFLTQARECLLNEKTRIRDIANQLNIRYEIFNYEFKKATGTTPTQWRKNNNIKAPRARSFKDEWDRENILKQIKETPQSIQSIADDLNCSILALRIYVKNETGMTPKQYRIS